MLEAVALEIVRKNMNQIIPEPETEQKLVPIPVPVKHLQLQVQRQVARMQMEAMDQAMVVNHLTHQLVLMKLLLVLIPTKKVLTPTVIDGITTGEGEEGSEGKEGKE